MLRIALPNKGRLSEDARELFADAGLEVRARGERALTAALGDAFEAIFVRAQDIPEFVADGAADVGVTGWDLVSESDRALTCLADLEFGRCRLAVAAREDTGVATLADIPSGARIATSFPRLTERFFGKRRLPVEVVPVSGAAEIAPTLTNVIRPMPLIAGPCGFEQSGAAERAVFHMVNCALTIKPGATVLDRLPQNEAAGSAVLPITIFMRPC